jgi:DNA-binding transcriptional LysR family regulator
MQFPDDVHTDYVAAVLQGLQQTEPKDLPDEKKAQWAPASIELIEAVIARFFGTDDPYVASQFCHLLRDRACEPWSESALTRLARYAMHHPQPGIDELVTWKSGDSDHASDASTYGLETNAINVVRGQAALAIRSLLYEHPDWLEIFDEALCSLVSDKHPAVRVAAVEACLPVLNIDRDKAVRWFSEACRDDPRVTACRIGVYFFNCCMESHRPVLEPLVRAMMTSQLSEVSQRGAAEVTARWLFHGYFEEELELCKTGTVSQRKGVAETVGHFVLNNEYSDRCRPLLDAFSVDPDSEVRSEIKRAFWDQRIFETPSCKEMISKYIDSLAYQDDPTPLFRAMGQYAGSLLPYADHILEIANKFAGPLRDASRDMSTSIAGDVRSLPPILLRLYEQAQDAADVGIENKCLDAWDKLFRGRVGLVRELTNSMEE